MEKVAIVVIIALAITVVALIINQNKEKIMSYIKPSVPKFDMNSLKIDIPIRPKEIKKSLKRAKETYKTTITDSKGFIEHINEAGEVLDAYELPVISSEGVCINRAGAPHIPNQITVRAIDKANTISSDAYYIFYDNEKDRLILAYPDNIEKVGYGYINTENRHNVNSMYYYDEKKGATVPSESFVLVDGRLFCLGKQWFRYVETPLPTTAAANVFSGSRKHVSPEAPPVAPKTSTSYARRPMTPNVDNDGSTKSYPTAGKF